MTDKEMKKLERKQMLEILLHQREKIDKLEKNVELLCIQVEERRMKIEKVNNVAEASLALSNVFDEARKAADQYLYNVKAQCEATSDKKEENT